MSRFVANPLIEKELLLDDDMRDMLRGRANEAKKAAEIRTPLGPDPRYGHMRRTYVVTDAPDGVNVGNRHGLFHLLEWGSKNNVPQAPLRRGVQAVGLDLDEDPKE